MRVPDGSLASRVHTADAATHLTIPSRNRVVTNRPSCPAYPAFIEDREFLETVRLLIGLATSLIAIAAQRLPICCHPRVGGSRKPVDPRNMVQPRDPLPVSQPAHDLIGRVRTHMDGVVGRNQAHAGVEVALNEFRESLSEPFRLPGNELERSAPIPTGNSSHPAATEGAVTIVDEGRLTR